MFQSLWWIALSAGITDAVNPSIFVLAAFVLLIGRLRQHALWLQCVLLISAIVSTTLINAGLDAIWFAHNAAIVVIKFVEGLIVILMVYLAYHSLIGWQKFHQGVKQNEVQKDSFVVRLLLTPFINFISVCILGMLLGVIISQWPADIYFNVLVNSMMVTGDFWQLISLWSIYVTILCWPVFLILILSRSNFLSKTSKELIFAGVAMVASSIGILIVK